MKKDLLEAINEMAVEILQNISSTHLRRSIIFNLRYGLNQGNTLTLEAVGDIYGLTRERIRQIEVEAIKQCKIPKLFNRFGPTFVLLEREMESFGGVVREDLFLKYLSPNPIEQNRVLLCLKLCDSVDFVYEDKNFYSSWSLKGKRSKFFKSFSNLLVLFGEEDYLEEKRIVGIASSIFGIESSSENYNKVINLLSLSKKIGKNEKGEWGMLSSVFITQRNIGDCSYVILKERGTPMHFREIAQEINKKFKKAYYEETCHNSLVFDKRFILVGRGVYALQDSNYSSKDILELTTELLSRAGGTMLLESLVKRIMKKKIVKETSIRQMITSSEKFNYNKPIKGFVSFKE